MTVADLNKFTISFVLDYIDTYFALQNKKNIHEDEEKYQKLKSVLPFVIKKHEYGIISDFQYNEFMKKYQKLEGRYGIYD